MEDKTVRKDRSLAVTFIMIATVAVLLAVAYFQFNRIVEQRCFQRLDEELNTVMAQMSDQISRESTALNAIAQAVGKMDNDASLDEYLEMMDALSPMVTSMRVRLLLPDNTVIDENGNIVNGQGRISFDELVPQGEHVSNIALNVEDGESRIIRHYVPIIKENETVAILYGVTNLEELPDVININDIYNSSANVYVINSENGNLIMDTLHERIENIKEFAVSGVKRGYSWEHAVQEILDGKSGYVAFCPEGQREWEYLYYAPAGINRWMIAVSVPESEAFSSLFAIRHVFLAVAALMAISVTLYYLWVRRNAKLTTEQAVRHIMLEEKLAKAEAVQRAKTQFLFNMSHDLRTPMNAVLGFAALAKNNLDDRPRLNDYPDKILSAGKHMLELINDVLEMSRLENEQLYIKEAPESLNGICEEFYRDMHGQADDKNLLFSIDTSDVSDDRIFCDKEHVLQILKRIAENAFKFTSENGAVSLTVRQEPHPDEPDRGSYEFRIKDNGLGMSREFADKVFDPFERERTSTVSRVTGTGLGMSIVKGIVDAMEGTIRVETEQGKGTEFIINLTFRLDPGRTEEMPVEQEPMEPSPKTAPIGQEPEEQTSPADLEISETPSASRRILIVDDNELNREIAEEILLDAGYLVESAEDGSIAVNMVSNAKEGYYDLILMDIQMPVMDGYEATRAIRGMKDPALASIPIVAMTANTFEEDKKNAFESGMNAHLPKPINVPQLLGVLESFFTQA